MKALCRLASGYISRIRVQFAEKAYDNYQNETIRRIVLAYGEEAEKLDAYRLRRFESASRSETNHPDSLEDDCLNKARSYADTIKFLFDIH